VQEVYLKLESVITITPSTRDSLEIEEILCDITSAEHKSVTTGNGNSSLVGFATMLVTNPCGA
jgi:hypothetical protein